MKSLRENQRKIGHSIVTFCTVCGARAAYNGVWTCGDMACQRARTAKLRGGPFARGHTLLELRDYYACDRRIL